MLSEISGKTIDSSRPARFFGVDHGEQRSALHSEQQFSGRKIACGRSQRMAACLNCSLIASKHLVSNFIVVLTISSGRNFRHYIFSLNQFVQIYRFFDCVSAKVAATLDALYANELDQEFTTQPDHYSNTPNRSRSYLSNLYLWK